MSRGSHSLKEDLIMKSNGIITEGTLSELVYEFGLLEKSRVIFSKLCKDSFIMWKILFVLISIDRN